MTEPVAVTDPDDPRLRDFTGLTDLAARSVREPAEGLFIAEGAKVIRRALAAGLQPRALLTEAKWHAELAEGLPEGVQVLLAEPEVLRSTTGYRVHRGALGSFVRPTPVPAATLLDGAHFVVVLVDLTDHTNVGAVFRNAAALGADAVLVTPGCADPLYRRAVKVSMGAVFSVPWTRSAPDPLDALAGWQTVALTPAPDAVHVDRVAAVGPTQVRGRALLLGTEGPGLPVDLLQRADLRARIPMAGGIDSLNVAAASAIAIHALRPAARGR